MQTPTPIDIANALEDSAIGLAEALTSAAARLPRLPKAREPIRSWPFSTVRKPCAALPRVATMSPPPSEFRTLPRHSPPGAAGRG